jgi:signal peptidase I
MRALRRALITSAPYAAVAALMLLALGFYEPVSVSGGSMVPALYPGDLVLVRRGLPPAAGRIALIENTNRAPVLHRVVRCGDDGSLTTRGDANAVDDLMPAHTDEISGTVSLVVPAGRLIRALLGEG